MTRGGRAKAEAVSRRETEAKLELDTREDELAQEAQETGPEGSRILGERGAEVQEWGRHIMAALEKRNPGQLEKRRASNGRWYTAGEEEEEEPQGACGDGSRWAGWKEVTQAWEAAGQVAVSMRMAWEDRDTAWRRVEVAMTDQQMGEARRASRGGVVNGGSEPMRLRPLSCNGSSPTPRRRTKR